MTEKNNREIRGVIITLKAKPSTKAAIAEMLKKMNKNREGQKKITLADLIEDQFKGEINEQ